MTDTIVTAADLVCWGAVVLVWIVGIAYGVAREHRPPIRGDPGLGANVAAIVVSTVVVLLGRRYGAPYLSFGATWVRLLGMAILIGSTAFAIWARLALGTSWSVAPRVGGDRQLRTSGPYAVTRHPIYTGLLGMLLGSTLLGGVGQWAYLVVVGVIIFTVKIAQEERLLSATFGDAYARYRREVPQLVPGLRWRRRPR